MEFPAGTPALKHQRVSRGKAVPSSAYILIHSTYVVADDFLWLFLLRSSFAFPVEIKNENNNRLQSRRTKRR